MRLFIAINLNDETQKKLLSLQNELRAHSKGGNYTLPDNLHLTLIFLGKCDAKQMIAIQSVMDASAFQPFPLLIEQLGRFKRNEGDVWWAGVHKSKNLIDLQHNLAAGLRSKDFQWDNRKYTPHITLGRKIISNLAPRQIEPFGEVVYKIDLIQSERVNGKLTYTSIYRRGKQEKQKSLSLP